jgi:hypothetical protein
MSVSKHPIRGCVTAAVPPARYGGLIETRLAFGKVNVVAGYIHAIGQLCRSDCSRTRQPRNPQATASFG